MRRNYALEPAEVEAGFVLTCQSLPPGRAGHRGLRRMNHPDSMNVHDMWAADVASRALGMELLEAAEGRAVVRMTVRDDMVNGHGTAHGGLVASLADSAFAVACNSHGVVTVAAGFDVTFLQPARAGDVLTATADERVRRRPLGRLRRDGDLVPTATSSPSSAAAAASSRRDRASGTNGGVQQRRIGDLTVSAIGLGGMPMSVRPTNDEGAGDRDDPHRRRERRHADRHRRRLLPERERVRPQRGAHRQGAGAGSAPGRTTSWSRPRAVTPAPGGAWMLDGRPEYLREACRGLGRAGSASSRSGSTSSTARTRTSPTRTASVASRTCSTTV